MNLSWSRIGDVVIGSLLAFAIVGSFLYAFRDQIVSSISKSTAAGIGDSGASLLTGFLQRLTR